MKKAAVFIDGGHLRACARQAERQYSVALITAVAKAVIAPDEELFRIQYYDCEPFLGSVKLPVSGTLSQYSGNDSLLTRLSREPLVAVRRGVLKFRGWERTGQSLKAAKPPAELTDADFKPKWEQKGVDLRIGLDIVTMTETRAVEVIALMTGDTDMIPAMKLARGRGLQIAGVHLPGRRIVRELKPHLDLLRDLPDWP